MSTSISVNKQTIAELLASGKNKPFVIPEYQRPYAWTKEEVDILFTDLWEFSNNDGGTANNGTYFLGSVVSYENEGVQEIIDGQQRITSLFLLLRAIYTKLKTSTQNDTTRNFIKQIEPIIWQTDKLTAQVDYSKILLTSKAINTEGNEVLRTILETGIASEDAKDHYSENYNYFLSKYEDYSRENPLAIFEFIYALLNQAILLPITADTQDTALTIFSTLNDRGLPLSDADIFKAKIYNKLESKEQKDEFIENWKNLEDEVKTSGEYSIQSLFNYYMFFLRAKNNDRKTTTIGLRKFYAQDDFKELIEPSLISQLEKILCLCKIINKKPTSVDRWESNIEILKALDILSSYPNEYWKYPVIIFYLSHKDKADFEVDFIAFLKKLVVSLLTVFLNMPTINAVKADILKLNTAIIYSSKPPFDFKEAKDNIEEKLLYPHRNVIRMVLKLHAYQKQDFLLPNDWEIEHIFPRKWQDNYFPQEDTSTIQSKIEYIGNKIPLEKKLNITASNGYFEKKKQEYRKSNIEIAKELGNSTKSDWTLDDIVIRNTRLTDSVISLLSTWG